MAVYRMERDGGSKDEDNGATMFGSLKMALSDYRLYLLAVIIITKTTAGAVTQYVLSTFGFSEENGFAPVFPPSHLFPLSRFFPTVVQTFGFSKIMTLVLTAPPYLVTAVLSLIISRMSDRKGERAFHLAVPLAFGLVGFAISAATVRQPSLPSSSNSRQVDLDSLSPSIPLCLLPSPLLPPLLAQTNVSRPPFLPQSIDTTN